MSLEEQKLKAEAEISTVISKKIAELRKKTGKEVSEIEFTPKESMTGLEGYTVKIKLI
ncbi:GnsA/GnsB family addiction module toxin [Citrobacter koseri]|uniref:GnsA/GnsB family addiction module toxin n=1 Tax=Citrobacter koseri TaxID=545 RepID=UPI0018E0F37F|nr:addiction module toxin, GnsA/GnsB family [Citrobacter koseri]HCJ7694163.1 addiction module toxin, GnsA/GnsB family [Citrobacter freundii]EKW5657376.1 addiction module toxin, GnsA/GnsB family [Citrobacter koseri]MBI0678625.1 addiction module toxin, GnsA/GnsB family [Citrobacter koseri]MBJ8810981.1 addiction module toxin, GnsA/GnsB family [Citrobacter koseri]MBJ9119720.1 addiction module toxin, GnsA/GnsB family [Citrobacter koseri]